MENVERLNHTFKGEKNHKPSDIWESDDSGHWHECKDCKEKLDFAVHIPDHEGHATEDYAITCKVCGWVMEEQVKQIQMEIPYKLVVKKTGEADPTKAGLHLSRIQLEQRLSDKRNI